MQVAESLQDFRRCKERQSIDKVQAISVLNSHLTSVKKDFNSILSQDRLSKAQELSSKKIEDELRRSQETFEKNLESFRKHKQLVARSEALLSPDDKIKTMVRDRNENP